MRSRRVSVDDVALQLGHKRMRVTETYTAFSPDYLLDAANALKGLVEATTEPVDLAESPQVSEKMVGATGIEPVTPPV